MTSLLPLQNVPAASSGVCTQASIYDNALRDVSHNGESALGNDDDVSMATNGAAVPADKNNASHNGASSSSDMVFDNGVENTNDVSHNAEIADDTYASRAASGPQDPLSDGESSRFANRALFASDVEREFHPHNIMPDRPCTAFFFAGSDITSKDIFDGLVHDGIPATSVRCLQRSPNGSVFITFANSENRDTFLQRSSFIARHRHHVTHTASQQLTFLTVYDAPHELPDSAIKERLKPYCRVFSARRGKLQGYSDVFNGRRHLRVDIYAPIPCYLRFGKHQLRFSYTGQPKTCRKCGAADHIARDCGNTVCFNCDQIGHVSRDCTAKLLCCICKADTHMAVDCQHSWYRRPRLADAQEYPALNEVSVIRAAPGTASEVAVPESAPQESTPQVSATQDSVPPETAAFRSTAPACGILTESSSEEEDIADTTTSTTPAPLLNSDGLLVPQASRPAGLEPSASDHVLSTLFETDDDTDVPTMDVSETDHASKPDDVSTVPTVDLSIDDDNNENVDDDGMGDSASFPESVVLYSKNIKKSIQKNLQKKLRRPGKVSSAGPPTRKTTIPSLVTSKKKT